MRTKVPKTKRTRTKHKESAPIVRTRTKKVVKKCNREYPCGGCVPNPPDAEHCPFSLTGYCGAPCTEITACAFLCKRNETCVPYQEVKRKLKDRHREDVRARQAILKQRQEEADPKPKKKKKEEEPTPRKRTRTKTR